MWSGPYIFLSSFFTLLFKVGHTGHRVHAYVCRGRSVQTSFVWQRFFTGLHREQRYVWPCRKDSIQSNSIGVETSNTKPPLHTLGTSVLPLTICKFGPAVSCLRETSQVLVVNPPYGDGCSSWIQARVTSVEQSVLWWHILSRETRSCRARVMMRSHISPLSRSFTPVGDTTASSSRRSRLMNRQKTIPLKIEEV